MKMIYWVFMTFLIPPSLPSPAFSMGDRTNGEGAHNCQAVHEQLIGNLANMEGAQRVSLEKGLQIISQLLIKIPKEGNREMFEKHAQQLGFKLDDQIDISRAAEFLRNAFPIFEVSLKNLRDFAAGKDVNSLLFDTCQRLIPIQVDKEVKSSVTIRLVPGTQGEVGQKEKEAGWRPTRWGLPRLTDQLTRTQKRLQAKNPGLQGFRLVSIPSLNRNFLGYEEDTDLKFVPLVPDRLFKNEEPLSANEVFLSLSQEAQKVDDLPR
jgi:hypothetical protein